MIDILSAGYFIRWAFNWIQAFAAEIVQTIEAGFNLSAIDIEDQDLNQVDMLQNKLITATNTASSSELVPMLYTQSFIPSAFTTITIEAGAYIKSVCLSGVPGAYLYSTILDNICNGNYDSVIADSLAGGVYTPHTVSISENIDGVVHDTAGSTLTLAGSTTATEEYQICIVYLQPTTLARQVVR